MTFEEFFDLSVSVGVPPELIVHEGWAKFDKNGDDVLCVKDVPDTPGHLGSWIFNVVDNIANH